MKHEAILSTKIAPHLLAIKFIAIFAYILKSDSPFSQSLIAQKNIEKHINQLALAAGNNHEQTICQKSGKKQWSLTIISESGFRHWHLSQNGDAHQCINSHRFNLWLTSDCTRNRDRTKTCFEMLFNFRNAFLSTPTLEELVVDIYVRARLVYPQIFSESPKSSLRETLESLISFFEENENNFSTDRSI